ncbi:MAG: aminotransferase class V-fold PLP-dependent enzyme [Halomonas sp.]|nr:aminotransferase class V-fold PLP-dependent enzyme [Halomonas sp.]
MIGEGEVIPGPFGPRSLLYADYTASGRALGMVEEAMRHQVLPFYANTHTETSYTGKITTQFREAARQSVRESVGADAEYAVIFAGAGATAAINRCSHILGLQAPLESSPHSRPVVFVGPFEHHSNDLVWRECDVDLVRIPLTDCGAPCLETLTQRLEEYADRETKVAAFSAASNVTGIKTDVVALARLVHQHEGIVLLDYAASGPYVSINVAGTGQDDHIDGIFLSPHKFVGGPGSSGILVIRKALCRNPIPSVAGGGTVSYVTARNHRYVTNVQRREEAGTPGILGDIRAGFAFRIKDLVGAASIEARESELVEMAMTRWQAVSNIHLLGSLTASRLAIFSFNISAGGRDIHHNLIVAMLNDLFGIQARGGCSCAGPYGHELLSIDEKTAAAHEDLVQKGRSLYRPGWVRLGFNFFFSNETANYVISAVEFIARYAPVLMKLYSVDETSGVWLARNQRVTQAPTNLLDALLAQDTRQEPAVMAGRDDYFAQAQRLIEHAKELPLAVDSQLSEVPVRWFWWPHEAEQAIQAQIEIT